MKNWVKLAVLVVGVVVFTQLVVRRPAPPRTDGREAAPPLALEDLSGRRVDLASLRGRVVAVNFWATWCGPCQLEIPELAQVWAENRDRCFDLLGVAEESAPEDIRRMSMSGRIPYPILVDERASALAPWGVGGYPSTFIVDAEGKVQAVFQGALEKRQLEEAIRPLLPKTCPARS